jgi:hypothetical protein
MAAYYPVIFFIKKKPACCFRLSAACYCILYATVNLPDGRKNALQHDTGSHPGELRMLQQSGKCSARNRYAMRRWPTAPYLAAKMRKLPARVALVCRVVRCRSAPPRLTPCRSARAAPHVARPCAIGALEPPRPLPIYAAPPASSCPPPLLSARLLSPTPCLEESESHTNGLREETGREERKKEREKNRRKGERKKRKRKEKKKMKEKGGKKKKKIRKKENELFVFRNYDS